MQWEKDHFGYNFDLGKGNVGMHFFKGGKTNVCFNALDRHVERGSGDRPCLLWEGNEPGDDVRMSYREVLERTCKLVSCCALSGFSLSRAKLQKTLFDLLDEAMMTPSAQSVCQFSKVELQIA